MMYKNYGDKNFFEYGFLVDVDNINEDEVYFLYCRPFDDEDDLYLYGEGCVDLNDDWIDWSAVEQYADVKRDTDYWETLARAVVSYYGLDNFCSMDGIYGGRFTKQQILGRLYNVYNMAIDWSEVEAE